MNRLFLLVSAIFLIGSSVNAQIRQAKPLNSEVKTTTPSPAENQPVSRDMAPRFTETTVPISSSETENQTILQELNFLEDQRNLVENDKTISSSERTMRIQEINSNYMLKKQNFYDYVSSVGILNITKQEQSFYLSMLKADGRNEEYQEGINSIKNSK